MTNTRNEIREFIVRTFLFGQELGLEDRDSLLDNSVIDSTGVLELVTHIEHTYRIRVNEDELFPENLDSIEGIVAYIGRKQSQMQQR